MTSQKKLSDKDFINNYTKRRKHISRSNKYEKGKENSLKGFGYIFFLIIAFIVAYLLFSNFLFPPQL